MDHLERLARVVGQLVRGVQACARVRDHAEQNGQRQRFVAQLARAADRFERAPLDPLEHDEGRARVLTEIENLSDVGVDEPLGNAGLVEEHVVEATIGRVDGEDRLERHELFEAVFAAQAPEPHRPHPALGDGADDLVAIQLGAWSKRFLV